MTSIDKATLPSFFRDEKPEEVSSELTMFIGDESEAVLITKGDHGLLVCMSFLSFPYQLSLFAFTESFSMFGKKIYENKIYFRQHLQIALLNYTEDAIRVQTRRSVKAALQRLLKWSNFPGRKKGKLN